MLPKDYQLHPRGQGQATKRSLVRIFLVAGLDAICVVGVSIITLRLWTYDLRVPFDYRSDTLWFAVLVKSMLQNGWTFNVPQLSAPYGLDAAAFPAMMNFDWGMMKIIGLFTADAGVVLNVFWLLSMVFSCWTAALSLRLLGSSRWLSHVGAVLFAFLPFAWLRHTKHIALTYYSVPLLCLLAIHLVHGRISDDRDPTFVRRVGYVGCLIQGFNYVYFSFFAVLLFTAAGAFGYARSRSRAIIKTTVTAVLIVLGAAVVNLAPSLDSWYRHGKPPGMGYKIVPEVEHYGAKIRKMLAPHPQNPIPLLAEWGARDGDAGFSSENENRSARLGPYGALGFLLLLAVAMSVKRDVSSDTSYLLRSIASLALFTLLIITVGGFGAVINVLVGPEIRAYNRFSVFLAFFSIAGLSLWADARIRGATRTVTKWGLVVVVSAVALLSLIDQVHDGRDVAASESRDMSNAAHERAVVAQLERYLPPGTMVFQLPVTVFPPDPGVERMEMYDHARPYLWSQHLRWSWPSFSHEHRAWLENLEGRQGAALVEALALSGFGAVWVDRFGYADGGGQIVQSLVNGGARGVPLIASPRYAAFDIQDVRQQLQYSMGEAQFDAKATDLLRGAVTVEWAKGFYAPEKDPNGTEFRWSRARSQLAIRNLGPRSRVVHLGLAVASHNTGLVDITGGGVRLRVALSSAPSETELELRLAPNEVKRIDFTARVPRVRAAGETRELYFRVLGLKVSHTVVSR